MKIDPSTPFGQRVIRRLNDERIAWLTTVDNNGIPQPRPVWFLWDGETFLIYSKPETAKLRHIVHNPRLSLNFDGDGQGGDIIVFTGQAWIDADAPAADQVPAYVEKYRPGIERIGMTPAQFAQTYTVAVRVRPTHLRGQ